MKYAFIYLIFAVFSVLTCVSTNNVSDNHNQNNWTYKIEITSPGTRSEGQLGHLFYNKQEIGPFFDIVVVGDAVYEYRLKRRLWDFGGYVQITDNSYTPVSCKVKITDAEITQGWYISKITCKKQGTPSDWIWIKRDDLNVFVYPKRIGALVHNYKLEPISGGLMFERNKLKSEN